MLAEFCRQYDLPFKDLALLKLALTHRSYLSVTGQGPRESNERLEFLGDSVLGLVTSEFLYRRHPDEHEGQLTKTKSLLVSKAILSRRALRIGLGRFVLMSHSEVESGGRQRLSILADAFESVIGAIYLDQGFEPARAFIHKHLLAESDAITSDKRHTNYKSHLQEYVQNAFRTHPVYRIRSEYGPDHSKHFMVEVMVGKRTLGEGRGHNKKEAEQAAARDALEKVERLRRRVRDDEDRAAGVADDHWEEDTQEREGGSRGGSERREPTSSAPRREPHESGRREPRARRDAESQRADAERPQPEQEPMEPVSGETTEAGEGSDGSRRRRRSRRGGRSRHGERGPRGAGAEASAAGDAPAAGHNESASEHPDRGHAWADADPDDDVESPRADFAPEPGTPVDRDARFRPAEEPSLAELPERQPLAQWEERSLEPDGAGDVPAAAPAAGRAMSFGRGRRSARAAGPGETRSRGASSGASAGAPAEDRRVDVFANASSAAEAAAPETVAPGPGAAMPPSVAGTPVVDVAAEDGIEVESERDREARIEEMERALDSFGRRRTTDYGRRGRRR